MSRELKHLEDESQILSASTTSTLRRLSGKADFIRLSNVGSVVIFYELGSSSVVATSTGGVVLPNSSIDIPLNDALKGTVEDYIAIITASSTSTVYIDEATSFKG